jgi:hypothetical protein
VEESAQSRSHAHPGQALAAARARHGLPAPGAVLERRFDAPRWEATAHSPGADAGWIARGKLARALGRRALLEQAFPWWESRATPSSGLPSGGRASSDHVLAESFEVTAGVDVDGTRALDDAACRLVHEACAPEYARFILRRMDGTAIPLEPGDRLVPTTVRGGVPVEVLLRARGGYVDRASGETVPNRDVAWRVRRGGALLTVPEERVEGRRRLLGLAEGVHFEPPPALRSAGAWNTAWWGRSWVSVALDASGRAAPDRDVASADPDCPEAPITFDPAAVEALLAHLGPAAFDRHEVLGARRWGLRDALLLSDGTELRAHTLRLGLADGRVRDVARVVGGEVHPMDRGPLYGPGVRRVRVMDGAGRRIRLCVRSLGAQAATGDGAIVTLHVLLPDGSQRVLERGEVQAIAWEDDSGMPPEALWRLHGLVGARATAAIDRDGGCHPWSTAIRTLETREVPEGDLTAPQRAALARPGAVTGSASAGRSAIFETRCDLSVWRYWVRFGDDGSVEDFAYLSHDCPALAWRSRLRERGPWPGGASLPGVTNEELRRLWLAAVGGPGDARDAAPLDLSAAGASAQPSAARLPRRCATS